MRHIGATGYQTRNKISSRSRSLPNEILAEIFKDVVYAPAPRESRYPSMEKTLKRIYGRLHSLLGVCSTWRNVGISLNELWAVIPGGDTNSNFPKPAVTSLVLQRSQALTSGNPRVHLAVILSNRPTRALPCAQGTVPRYTSINIETRFKSPACTINILLAILSASQSPGVLAELAICQCTDETEGTRRPRLPQQDEYIGHHLSTERRNLLNRSLWSLSTLRVRNANINWNIITFSDKFVQIHLRSLVLEVYSALHKFLGVLESALELRDLKMTDVVSSLDPDMDMPPVISLPNLQLLLLDDLSFNVLNYVLASIPPGSQVLKVGLTPKSERIHYYSQYDLDSDDDSGMEAVFGLLNRSNIDTLFLDTRGHENLQVNRGSVRSILESLPGLKTLILESWKWDPEDILALERPENSKFAALTELYILNSRISTLELLPRVAESHPLQMLVLERAAFKNEDYGVYRQLKQMVPGFRCLARGVEQVDDFHYSNWRLG